MTERQNKAQLPAKNKSEQIKTHVLQPVKNQADKEGRKPQQRRPTKYPIKKTGAAKTRSPYPPAHIRRHNNYKPYKQTLAEKLVKTFTALIAQGIKTIIPWVLFSLIIFAAGAYYVYITCFAGHQYPLWYMIIAGIILFGFYAFFGLVYGTIMGLLYTAKSFSEAFGALIRETINRIKNSIESKIDNVADTISKNEASQVVKQTFDELSVNIRKYAARTAAGVTALAILGSILFICRKALLTSFSKIKNKADFFTIMSARAALVAAIILNLTFFTKLAIITGYLIGIIMIGTQAIMVLLLK